MLRPCCKDESGLKKTGMHVVTQTTFYWRTCKNHTKLWLIHAKVFERESKMNILQQFYAKDMILFFVPFFLFFCFLIKNFNLFWSSFYYCNCLKILTTMLIPDTTLIKNGSSFPSPSLFRAALLFGREEYLLFSCVQICLTSKISKEI